MEIIFTLSDISILRCSAPAVREHNLIERQPTTLRPSQKVSESCSGALQSFGSARRSAAA